MDIYIVSVMAVVCDHHELCDFRIKAPSKAEAVIIYDNWVETKKSSDYLTFDNMFHNSTVKKLTTLN